MTHLPKNPYCPICMGSKIKAKPAKVQQRKTGNPEVDPQRFGDLLLADHIVLVDSEAKGSKGESAGLMLKDAGTGWLAGPDADGHEVQGKIKGCHPGLYRDASR